MRSSVAGPIIRLAERLIQIRLFGAWRSSPHRLDCGLRPQRRMQAKYHSPLEGESERRRSLPSIRWGADAGAHERQCRMAKADAVGGRRRAVRPQPAEFPC